MGKGAIGLTAGYWPEEVFRYLAVPSIYLDEGLVGRSARRFPDKPAVVFEDPHYTHRHFTYQELMADMDRTSRAVLSLLGGRGSRLAIGVKNPVDFLKLFLGALKGFYSVVLLDPSLPPEKLKEQLASFQPHLFIADEPLASQAPAWCPGVPVASPEQVWQIEAPAPAGVKRVDRKAPVIAMSGKNGHLFYHSHSSLLAGGLSWSAFIPLKEEDIVLSLQPQYKWEGLYEVAATLFRGATCLFGNLEDRDALTFTLKKHQPAYVWITLEQAQELAAQPPLALLKAMGENLMGISPPSVVPSE